MESSNPFDYFKSTQPVPPEIQAWGDRLTRLMDPRWIKDRLVTNTEKEVAKELHVAPETLRRALKYHGIVLNRRSSVKKA